MTQDFSTYDLGLATYLRCKSYEIVDMQADERRKVFIFEDSPELQDEVKLYWDGKSRVDALKYWNELKNLKNRIYSSSI